MRRALTIAVAAAALLVTGLLVTSCGGETEAYRVAAVFDTARGMVPGQLVKIAGARVGTVTAVRLVPGPAARIEMRIDAGFGPFGADAGCRILPEGFISEHYVECDPGDRSGPVLKPGETGLPTIARARNAVPLDLQEVLNVFSAPTPQRLQVLITELGLGTAGRGTAINGILRRANPALDQARSVLTILGDENQRLETAVTATDAVLDRLARQREDVRRFIGTTAKVTQTTADRRRQLGETVRELPATLAATRRGLASIRRVAAEGKPTLDRLRAAAPGLVTATATIPAFVGVAAPAVDAIAETAREARPVVHRAGPTVRRFGHLSAIAHAVLPALDDLVVDLQRTGGIEGIGNLPYRLAAQSAAYDGVSHMAGVFIGVHPQCLVDVTTAGCGHAYTAPGGGTIPVNAPSAGAQPHPDTVSQNTAPATPAEPTRVGRRATRDLLDWLLQ